MLDRNGHLVDDPENSYALYGTVVLGGQTFSGLLLEGKPTAFGARARRLGPGRRSGRGRRRRRWRSRGVEARARTSST